MKPISIDDHSKEVLVLVTHGNAEDVTQNLNYLYQIRETHNVSVLAIEYPGYGYFKYRVKDGEIDLSSPL